MTTTGIDCADYAAMRHAMVASQLRTNAVNDQRVVAAMATVPRERFLPERVRAIGYRDTAIPLGEGRGANPPMVTGRLLTEAYLDASDRVLLIGAATGYAAAVLAGIVAAVVAVEEDAKLAAVAEAALADRATVRVVQASLATGAPDAGPFDVMVIDGAVPALPEALVKQVKPGGRIVTGLVARGVTRLASGRRTEGGHGVQPFMDADCVVLPGFAEPATFRF